jgi:heme-degrading monooxygenase HmoA
MLKPLLHQFTAIAAIVLFFFGILIGIPSQAQAATAVSLDGTNEMVNVVTVYPTTPNTQSQVLSQVSKAAEAAAFSNVPGFKDSAILKAQDGTQVIALSQWQGKDLSSFQAYADEHVLNISADHPPQTFACQVQHTETRTTSSQLQQGDAMMFSQFKMKPGKEQSELATIISQMMPGVLQMIPGLQWAAMCPSTDKSTIALLARWNSRKDFESLGQNPGFDKETNYWQDYAVNEHGLYDVAQIIR